MNNPKLYQNITERQLSRFMKILGTTLEEQKLVEIKDEKNDLFGDFIVINGYKFKYSYGTYQCLQTPTEKHQKTTAPWSKAQTDYYKKK